MSSLDLTRRNLVTVTQLSCEREWREATLPERTWRTSGRKERTRASAVLPDAGRVLRQRDEVKAMAASETIARASLL